MWLDVDQNSDEWLEDRSGKLTGSNAGKVMANYGKAFGEPAKKLAAQIAIEQVNGHRVQSDNFTNASMERGHEQEPIARQLYEEMYFVDVTNGGFYDNGDTGCSPDGLVLDNGVIEIKSVLGHVHYSNIIRNKIDPAYKWQCYFNLIESGRDWIDFVSYSSDFPEKTRLWVFRTHIEDIFNETVMIKERVNEFRELIDKIKPTVIG